MELIDETEKVCLYSPKYNGETYNEFEKFLLANRTQTHPQLKKFFGAILSVLEKIGETGAYERYFRPEGGMSRLFQRILIITEWTGRSER